MVLAERLTCMGLFAPEHVGSSPSPEHTCVPCIGRQIPILVPPEKFSLYSLSSNQLFSFFLFFFFCILSYMRYSCTDDCVFEIHLFCSIGLFFWYHGFIYSGQLFNFLFYNWLSYELTFPILELMWWISQRCLSWSFIGNLEISDGKV